MAHNYFNNKQKIRRHVNKRLHVVIALCLLSILILIGRLAYLQLYKHHAYTTLSEKNYLAIIPIQASRGIIYDRNHQVIADNKIIYRLVVAPDHIQHAKKIIKQLDGILPLSKVDSQRISKNIRRHRSSSTPLVVMNNLTEKEVAQYYINQYRLDGLIIQPQFFRQYPASSGYAHIIGHIGRIDHQDQNRVDIKQYTGDDYIGKTGIEYTQEKTLHGTIGYQQVEVDASGHEVRVLKTKEPTPGKNITLTIDAALQKMAYNAMDGYEGSIVVLNAKTGGVLALVSHPSFDPNIFVNGIDSKAYRLLQKNPNKPMYNRSLHGLYAPGSTIKPFVALAALQNEIITPTTRYHDPGWFKLPHSSHQYRDWNWYRGGHGSVDLRKALIVSCDTFFYRSAFQLGITRMAATLGQFGFGEETTIELANQSVGINPTPAWKTQQTGKSWYQGDTVITGIGQGFMLSTPLQLANATMIFANKGRAHPITLLLDKAHHEEQEHNPAHDISIDSSHWKIINNGLEGVITSRRPWGTGYAFGRNPPYTVAAKTGTAQVYSIKNRHNNQRISQVDLPKKLRDNALFIAYTPTEDPELIVAVVIEHTSTSTATRIARKICDHYYRQKKIKGKPHGNQ